jgi:hypothetical protein
MFCHTNEGSLASLGAVDGLEAMGLRGVVAFGAEDAADPQPLAAVLAEHQALAERCAARSWGCWTSRCWPPTASGCTPTRS